MRTTKDEGPRTNGISVSVLGLWSSVVPIGLRSFVSHRSALRWERQPHSPVEEQGVGLEHLAGLGDVALDRQQGVAVVQRRLDGVDDGGVGGVA